MSRKSLWARMDDGDKANMIKIAGGLLAIFTIFTLLSNLSYLFTWRADQSLLTDPQMLDKAVPVHNICHKAGYKWAHLLTGKLFGLASFILLVPLYAVSVRLLAGKWKRSLLRTTIESLSGAIVLSLTLSFIASLFGPDLAFGGGLGGECGSSITASSVNLVGVFVTGLLVLLLIAAWFFFCGKRFSAFLSSIGKSLSRKKPEPDPAPVPEPSPVSDPAPVPAPVPAPAPEPRPAPVPAPAPLPAPVANPQGAETQTGTAGTVGTGKTAGAGTAETEAGQEGTLNIIKDEKGLSTENIKDLPPFDNRTDPEMGLANFKAPSLDLLDDYASSHKEVSNEEITRNNNKIRATLANYKIQIRDVTAVVGPTVTLYKVYPAPGVKISSIKNLQEDIAMSLNAKGVRVMNLPDSVGIEVANDTPSIVPLKATLNDDAFRESKAELPVAIGYTITQKVKVFDLADAPHLLVAGATKQGKSVGLNVIVSSLLYAKHPSELKLVFIDPKMVEFSAYANLLKHYLAVLPDAGDDEDEKERAIVKTAKDADRILQSLCIEMDERYKLLSKATVNNIKLYNEKFKARKLLPTEGHKYMPYLVVVIDEYADLTMSSGAGPDARTISRNITNSIIRLAQKGRAAGIHVILATQRPSVDVITGLIKTNFPTRIAFRVVTRVDSQTILDSPGAEKLIGKGDMLYNAGLESERVQCSLITGEETNRLTSFIGSQTGYKECYNTPYYLPEPSPEASEDGTSGGMIDMKSIDERFEEAARLVVTTQRGSTSDLQRRLGMGYAKAGRVMDQLEAAGVVGPQDGSKPRQVLVPDLDSLEEILKSFR